MRGALKCVYGMVVVLVCLVQTSGCSRGNNQNAGSPSDQVTAATALPSADRVSPTSTDTPEFPTSDSATMSESLSSNELMSGAPSSDDGTSLDATDGNDVASSSVPPVISDGTTVLTIANATDPQMWQEGSKQQVSARDRVQAIYAEVSCSTDQELEFRFNQQSGTLSLDLSQSLDSPSSDDTLEVSLKVDGRTAMSKDINFKGNTRLTQDLTGVAVVKVVVKNVTDECSSAATVLITNMRISQ